MKVILNSADLARIVEDWCLDRWGEKPANVAIISDENSVVRAEVEQMMPEPLEAAPE